jgi:lipopolysaccharide export system permease protein
MRTLHLYLTRQVLATLGMTLFTCTFVLLLANTLREVLALVVGGQATLALVARAILLLIPFVLAYALPIGMLTATLLVFGRFSADQELTAVRASGVSLVALCTPVLLLSLVVSGLAALLNMQVAPQCRVAFLDLLVRTGVERASAFIVEGRFMDEFPGYVVYVGRKHDTNLEEVLISKLGPDRRMESLTHAARAQVVSDLANQRVTLRLQDVTMNDFVKWGGDLHAGEHDFTLERKASTRSRRDVDLSDMTFLQLSDKLRDLERLARSAQPPPGVTTDQLRQRKRQLQSLKADLTMPVLVQLHRQVAFSFASIGFTLIGIPLGIRAHRRETSAGVAMALLLVLLYYAFVILGQALQGRPELAPHLLLWAPNFLFQTVGAVLLWRANRGF